MPTSRVRMQRFGLSSCLATIGRVPALFKGVRGSRPPRLLSALSALGDGSPTKIIPRISRAQQSGQSGVTRVCAWCENPVPARARHDAVRRSVRCRQARHRGRAVRHNLNQATAPVRAPTRSLGYSVISVIPLGRRYLRADRGRNTGFMGHRRPPSAGSFVRTKLISLSIVRVKIHSRELSRLQVKRGLNGYR